MLELRAIHIITSDDDYIFIDKHRKETKFVFFLGGRKTCCQVFSSVCKRYNLFSYPQVFRHKSTATFNKPSMTKTGCPCRDATFLVKRIQSSDSAMKNSV